MNSSTKAAPSTLWQILCAIGPAIIVASVVVGPGSLLLNSKVGAEFEFGFVWLLLLATLLMGMMTAVSARIGVVFDHTPCQQIAHELGRPIAVVVGLTLFLITTCFQVSNNIGVMGALNLILTSWVPESQLSTVSVGLVIGLNAFLIFSLYGTNKPYQVIEKLMMILVGLMLVGFLWNACSIQPDVTALLKGIVPSTSVWTLTPDQQQLLIGMIATTCSIAGAFYQGYAVREKGWTRENYRSSLVDVLVGIGVLGAISLLVMTTTATVLQGTPITKLEQVADQLTPLLGSWARLLFGIGLFAGALSSLLGNVLIGGTVLADGLGYSSSLETKQTRHLTTAGLLAGMIIALGSKASGIDYAALIVLAQALTVIGVPMLALALVYLTNFSKQMQPGDFPIWQKGVAWFALLLSVLLACNQLNNVMIKIQKMLAS